MAKGKSPAFSFYAGDWLGSIRIAAMTPDQEGAYIRLLAYAWGDPDCSLPDDDATLAAMSRLGERWFNGCSAALRDCFEKHPTRPGRIYNKRLLKERQKQAERSEKAASAGVRSGQARRCGSKVRSANVEPTSNGRSHSVEPTLNISSSFSSSSSYTDPITKKDIIGQRKRRKFTYPAAFESWWRSYPRRSGKDKALAAWQKAIERIQDTDAVSREEAQAILEASASEFAASDKGMSGEYCPHPATWLNGGHWQDDRQSWKRSEPQQPKISNLFGDEKK
jgi:uncharacterized protein YdaU (DUF1376 family)